MIDWLHSLMQCLLEKLKASGESHWRQSNAGSGGSEKDLWSLLWICHCSLQRNYSSMRYLDAIALLRMSTHIYESMYTPWRWRQTFSIFSVWWTSPLFCYEIKFHCNKSKKRVFPLFSSFTHCPIMRKLKLQEIFNTKLH